MTNTIERKPLLLAFLTGLCGNASLAALTSAHVNFSIFPIIAFVFAISALWQSYVEGPMAGDTPRCALAMFFIGALGYSSFLRAEFPDIGHNLIQIFLCLGLAFYVAVKMGFGQPNQSQKATEAEPQS
ncbi:YijD family membrane protein [Motilimonas eburnea]|uniref:YijD family membrane protein n=1 Tax=Motilimonas eburnea TaxID=1737488 RepID=UPI001E640114|nr:YijD family membrane protein [Motilimonas eburnea]MCE2573561.1 YijD family membrane protein [Motilimonas eburnea]